ncbi:MAG TPA: DUF4442 domain-containing protein [bacterium]|nr:DUF4442 domain-containing protein [bacterium]
MTEWKKTLGLRAFGLLKIPLLCSVRPTILRLNRELCEIRIPLNYWTRNHLKSMYFGTLAIGADCAGGLLAQEAIRKSGKDVVLIFKDFHADFLKRAEHDVHFTCKDGLKIEKQVKETVQSGERTNQTLTIVATTPKVTGDEPVAKFLLTLSLKLKSGKSK